MDDVETIQGYPFTPQERNLKCKTVLWLVLYFEWDTWVIYLSTPRQRSTQTVELLYITRERVKNLI